MGGEDRLEAERKGLTQKAFGFNQSLLKFDKASSAPTITLTRVSFHTYTLLFLRASAYNYSMWI